MTSTFARLNYQAPTAAALPLLQLDDWDPDYTYDESSPTCVHYPIEWKLQLRKGRLSKLTNDTEQNLVLAPGAFWETTLEAKVDKLLKQKTPRGESYVPEETIIVVSVNDRSERDLTKRFDDFNIDWEMAEEQLGKWSHTRLASSLLCLQQLVPLGELPSGGATSVTNYVLVPEAGAYGTVGPAIVPLAVTTKNAMGIRLESPDLYTIGWIAALPIERAAVTALLHYRHDAPEGFDQRRSDTNSYTWGRIGQHNVVIASLPSGVYGTTSAATTASNLIHSLPHIRIGLLVGIGGGIARPDAGQDIRLGDVVVSQPDGTTGGVIQYDLGKAKANGGWERKGSLDKPPAVLLHALASLQAEHEIARSKVPDLLQTMLEVNPGMTRPKTDFTYQGAENDRLFNSKYDHIGGSNCDKCDSAWEVKRKQRDSTDPEIYYGIIASGNKLIKDAATRDSLLEDTGDECLCVEMEAAGLMDRFPCLVIRGICDYADSHKSDRWQRYAAATAAALAVELLEYVPAAQLEATQKAAEAIQSLERKIDSLNIPIHNLDYRTALNMLPLAEGASFDSRAEEYNPMCLPDTRAELLDEISCWISDSDAKTIFWLSGMAGTGKSTISRTVAQMRHKRGDLGASFFFKRGETDRGGLNKFVPTLARQLALRFPDIAPLIKKAIDVDPDVVSKTVKEQFGNLIREPLARLATTRATLLSSVMVIDALDECDRDADIKLLLSLLSSTPSTDTLQIRVLITSRPELPVRLGFQSIDGTYQDVVLHQISQPLIERDIAVFLRHELNIIREDFNNLKEELRLPVDWPGEDNILKLTVAASPLFIFAATVCRFISDSCLGSPDELLRRTLHFTRGTHTSKLGMTYLPVLEQQVAHRSGRERCDIIESFRLIVGTIVTLASPLSMRALALLLDVHVNKVTTRLRVLHSVLEVPDSLDLPVRLLHLSFRDYLVDPENRETVEFWVDEKPAHRRLAKHCLRVMRTGLRKNICSLPFPGMHRSALDAKLLEERISPELQYACMYWVHHQTKIDLEPSDVEYMYDFLETHFLHWLEVLSLIGRMAESIGLIDELQRIVDQEKAGQVARFLHDAKRFVLSYRWIVDTAPLQLYASAIVFAPTQSIVRQTFERYLPEWISLLPHVESNWNAVLQTLEEEQTLEGHTDWVTSVVFSNNGRLIASGSYDKTIKIWNVTTGINIKTIDTSQFTEVLSFTDDDTVLVTNRGHFHLKSLDDSTPQASKHEAKLNSSEAHEEVEGRLGLGISHYKTWITAGGPDGRKVLWLPSDFRPGVSATLTKPLGSVVVIGCGSGRVVIIGFGQSSLDEV
ncbi:related to RSA4-WD-repeat protein required for maturation and efficient intra-nuclear transport [Fusarium oxysporum]|uniref:Related to RSA4-WD-repeat protein required for maturation and efficient intra-nuclear transport n=1 Tax=Fusarium oxysporum TaxID=5507 RepID=A0A2H3TIA6_FUSOX|nr:related to RSA4-WD-repeat protein required for maturation and efficient intra-nuclear transport [Fusarium oxysporum]